MYPAGNLVKLAPTVINSAVAAGDIVFTKQEIKNAVSSRGGCSLLTTVTAFIEGAATNDDLTLLFFDNSTALGAAIDDPASDITADEFRTASCIGVININGGTSTISAGNGLLYSNEPNQSSSSFGASPLLIKAEGGSTSIWVAMIQPAGTLNMTDTDSMTLTFGFQYLD